MTADAPKPGLRESLRVFRHRNFRIFWLGGIISNSGRWLTIITVPAVLWDLTGSGAWVGGGGFATLIPAMLLGPVGGSLGDRYPRRLVLLATQFAAALLSIGQAITWAGGVREPLAYVLIGAASGAITGINLPCWQSFVTELVPREDLRDAVTLNSIQFTGSRIFGPALGGILLATFGPAWAFTLDAITYIGVLIPLLMIRTPNIVRPQVGRSRPLREARVAARYARGVPGVVRAILITGIVGLFGSSVIRVLVIVAEDAYGVGRAEFGFLVGAYGVGSVLVLPLITGWGRSVPRSRLVSVMLIFYGVSVMAVGLAPIYALGLVAMMGMGAGQLAVATTINAAMQLQVHEHTRSKVTALYLMVVTGSQPFGSLFMGVLADVVGIRLVVIVSGACIVALAFYLKAGNQYRTLDDELDADEALGGADAAQG